MKPILKNIFLVLVITACSLLSSCKKEEDPPPAVLSSPNTPTLSDFYKANSTSPQVMTLNAGVSYSITGTKGTELNIPVNAFMTGFGAIVTGTVEFSMIESYSKKDMILNKAQTMTSSDMLVNGGELKFSASQNGQPLKLYPGKKIGVRIPAGTTPSYSMQVFYGITDLTSNELLWQLAAGTPSSIAAAVVTDTTNVINPNYYAFNSDSLNWVSCNYFYNAAGPKTNVTITVHGNYNASNTSVFLAFNGLKSVAMLYGSNQTFSQAYQIPVGLNMTIIAISRINGNFYASYTASTVVANHTQDLNLAATSESEILAKLATY